MEATNKTKLLNTDGGNTEKTGFAQVSLAKSFGARHLHKGPPKNIIFDLIKIRVQTRRQSGKQKVLRL